MKVLPLSTLATAMVVVMLVLLVQESTQQTAKLEKLKHASFETNITTAPFLVEFYAPWCSHCKALEPVLSELAEEMKESTKVGLVDCSGSRSLCKRFGITEFPTLMFFKQGFQWTLSSGEPRTVANLKNFIETRHETISRTKRAAPDSVAWPGPGSGTKVYDTGNVWELTLENVAELFQKYKTGTWLIKAYTKWCGHCKKLEPIYYEVANTLTAKEGSSYYIGQIDCQKNGHLCQHFGANSYPTIVVVQGGRIYSFEEDRTKDKLLRFVENYKTVPSVPLTPFSNIPSKSKS